MGWLSPLFAVAATLIVGFVLFAALGKNPFEAFHVFCCAPSAWPQVTVLTFGTSAPKASSRSARFAVAASPSPCRTAVARGCCR
jgi:ABC-type uncharacterized transport system permease subunit